VRKLLIGLVLALETAALGVGCARPKVKTEPELPSLEVPLPPSRVMPLPEPDEADAVVPLPAEKPANAPSRPRPRSGADQTAKDAKKPEGTPAAEPPAPPQPGPPATPLQTTSPAGESEMVRRVDTLLGQARADLSRVKSAALASQEGKEQQATVRQFIEQAEQAKTEKNYVLAVKLAEKAATLAADLAAR
jgi:hypothetical protein